jgi:ubiquinone/menaquinone biosynthesis C-methylase UbiE
VAETDRTILEHYRRQAEEHDLSPSSTMADQVTRDLEVDAILTAVRHAVGDRREASLLEVGCGNGYLLQALRERFPALRLVGVDFSPDMLEVARRRGVERCELRREDVRSLGIGDGEFDVVVSERCLINLLDPGDQMAALREVHRVLAPGGTAVLVEAFTDGLENLNRARLELGLPENRVPEHNLWFDKQRFLEVASSLFEDPGPAEGVPPRNFLSSHYFISRVLYAAVTRQEILYNTEFVRFFRFLPPQGDYSPIQLFLLRKPVG